VVIKIRKILDYFYSAPIRLFYWFVPIAALLEILRYLTGANDFFELLAPIVLTFFFAVGMGIFLRRLRGK